MNSQFGEIKDRPPAPTEPSTCSGTLATANADGSRFVSDAGIDRRRRALHNKSRTGCGTCKYFSTIKNLEAAGLPSDIAKAKTREM